MSRCKACEVEFIPRINKANGEEEELCSECLCEARCSAYNIEADLDYAEEMLDVLDLFD